MPVSTPEALVPHYGKDQKHFSHVLEHLFVPAIKKADFEPLRPIAQGADVIHAEIIKNLETADLVLCDISALNPNVFFELGCRTALNKPVCYVMDDLTGGIPFDTGIINHHTYSSALTPWTLDADIELLSTHIRVSAARSVGKNMLWQYFGLRSSAHAAPSEGEEEDRVAYLVMQVDAIKKHLEDRPMHGASLPAYRLDAGDFGKLGGGTGYSGFGNVAMSYRDFDAVLANAENDLNQIRLLQKQNERPPDLAAVKSLIETHIKSLGELIDEGPTSERAGRAREVQDRYRSLLSKK